MITYPWWGKIKPCQWNGPRWQLAIPIKLYPIKYVHGLVVLCFAVLISPVHNESVGFNLIPSLNRNINQWSSRNKGLHSIIYYIFNNLSMICRVVPLLQSVLTRFYFTLFFCVVILPWFSWFTWWTQSDSSVLLHWHRCIYLIIRLVQCPWSIPEGSWRRHQMEIFFALLALTRWIPHAKVSFDVYFHLGFE